MTCRATRHHFLAPYLIIGFELRAFRLINIAILPIHVKNLVFWSNESLRRPVARYAPFHLQRFFLEDGRHVIDLAVTGRAPDALRHMDTVVKISVFGQLVHTFPLDRLIIAEAGPDRLKIRAVRPYLAMAVHTRLSRRHSCGGGCLDCLVAISTIDTVVAYVMFVAELDRLLYLVIASGKVRRAGDLGVRKKSGSAQYHGDDHADLGNIVRTFVEDLCHVLNISLSGWPVYINLSRIRDH